ncbi:hypothetical protein PCLA_09f0304 [Pseudomonas citronellolis]|nr:hypothetical protein PCLA_09f0304 [Pseudomonas citronellolis]
MVNHQLISTLGKLELTHRTPCIGTVPQSRSIVPKPAAHPPMR